MAENWRDSFRSWSHPDILVHPDSPAGGTGNGFARFPRYNSDLWEFSPVPHPDSPAGRRFPYHMVLLAENRKRRDARHKSRQTELNVYASFKSGPWKSDAEILAAINSNKDEWFPGQDELFAVAKGGKGIPEGVENVWNLLCAIARHRPTRLNIFTHAVSGYIGLSGRVIKGNVVFDTAPATEVNDEIISNADAEGFTFSDAKSKNITFKQVRDALGKHAVIVIYACHAGLDLNYLKQIARALDVTVKGFRDEIRYYPIAVGGKITGWKVSVGRSAPVSDFHDLDRFAVTP